MDPITRMANAAAAYQIPSDPVPNQPAMANTVFLIDLARGEYPDSLSGRQDNLSWEIDRPAKGHDRLSDNIIINTSHTSNKNEEALQPYLAVWDEVKEFVRDYYDLSPLAEDVWIRPLILSSYEGGILYIQHPGGREQFQELITERYGEGFLKAFERFLGRRVKVSFIS